MAWTADAIITPITTDLSGLHTGFNQAKGAANQLGGQMTGIFRNVGRTLFNPIVLAATGAVSAILSVRTAVRAVSAAMDSIDSVAKFSDRIGIATENLIGLRHAGELTGVATNQLDMGLQRMTRRLAEAAQGTGEAVSALKALNLDAQAMAAMSPDQQFLAIADAMEGVTSQSDRVRLAFKLFDSEGVGLVNTMNGGADAVRGMMAEAEKLGVTFDRVDAAKVEQANDAFNKAQKVIQGVVQSVAIELAPHLQAVAQLFTNAATEGGGFGHHAVNAIEMVTKAVAYAADYLKLFEAGWQMLRVGAGVALVAVLKPLHLIVEAVEWLWNKLKSGPPSDFSSGLGHLVDGIAEETRDAFDRAGEAFDDFASGANQARVAEFFDTARAKSQEAAEEIAANAARTRGAFDGIGEAALKQQERISAALDDITRDIEQFGMSDLDIRLAEFQAMEDVTDAQAAAFAQSIEQLKALRTGQEIQDAVDSWREGLKTPLEALAEQVEQIDKWRAEGLISDAEWQRGREQLAEGLSGMMPDTPTDTGPKLAGFIRAGSQEAFQLQAQIQSGQGRDQIPREQLRVAEDQRALLEEISRKLNLEVA